MSIDRTCTGTPEVVVALLTPPGRGALAVVGVAGARAVSLVDGMFAARGGRPVAGRADGTLAFGRWLATGEEVVVVRAGAERLEVHCHGGLAASAAIIAALVAGGGNEIGWGEWLETAGCDGGTVAAEAREALPLAGGPKAAGILCRQLAGQLDAEIVRLSRLVAAGEGDAARTAVDRLLRASRVGLRLTRPWRVVVAGAVNAGKSSLVNALAGHTRALVSPAPGTTRDLVETRLVVEGWEIDLVDTAGLRSEPGSAVEAAGIARAAAAAAAADLVLRVVSAEEPTAPASVGLHELLVLSKSDLLPRDAACPATAVRTSITTGEGIDELAARIAARIVPEEAAEPDLLAGAVPFTTRQVALVQGLLAD